MMRHPLLLQLVSSVMARSTNCLSARFPLQPLLPRMCWICICIAARLRLYWAMKTSSRRLTDGTLIPYAARSLFKSSRNGCGNLRLELGQQLSGASLCTTEFAPALKAQPASTDEPEPTEASTPAVIYGPPNFARPSFTHGFPGSVFIPQPDGTLRCPTNHPLYLQERRLERDGSLRILYAARIGHCRVCPLRAQCQESSTTLKPRRVSAVLRPIDPSSSSVSSPPEAVPHPPPLEPVLWHDWPRCGIRRTWLKVIRRETVVLSDLSQALTTASSSDCSRHVLTRAERAHWRLSWE